MNGDLTFNHVAQRVAAPHFETVVALFKERLGFVELRRTESAIWLRQPGASVDLQLARVAAWHDDPERARSQVSFLSETPRADLEALAAWLGTWGLAAAVGAYSEREFYLDIPGALVDFVIEAMRPELADYPLADDPQATAASALSNSGRPSVPPFSGSMRFSGCGIMPRMLRLSERMPAISSAEPFGLPT